MTELLASIGAVCVSLVFVALTVWILALLLLAIERCYKRWLPLFRTIYRFYRSLPSSKFTYDSRYFIVVYDRKLTKFTHVAALDEAYENEEEHERAREEFRQKLKKREASE